MLAESIHSVADTANQGLLFLGGKQAARPATPEHPFGYGRDRYFWSFVVALVLFSVGGVFAIYEGDREDPPPARHRLAGRRLHDPRRRGRARGLLAADGGEGVEPRPREPQLGRLRAPLQVARAAGGAAGGPGRPVRPVLRPDRPDARRRHRRAALGRRRDPDDRPPARDHRRHPGDGDEEPADRRVRDRRPAAGDPRRDRGDARPAAAHPHAHAAPGPRRAARGRQGRAGADALDAPRSPRRSTRRRDESAPPCRSPA